LILDDFLKEGESNNLVVGREIERIVQ